MTPTEKAKELLKCKDCLACKQFAKGAYCFSSPCDNFNNIMQMHKWTKNKFIKWYKANHYYTADTIRKLKKAMEE